MWTALLLTMAMLILTMTTKEVLAGSWTCCGAAIGLPKLFTAA
jgi:hypothetical protein